MSEAEVSHIVRRLHADPQANIAELVSAQAGPIVERLIAHTSDRGKRQVVLDNLEMIYKAVGQSAKTARQQVVALQLDGAAHRSVALTALRELERAADLLAEANPEQATEFRKRATSLRSQIEIDNQPNPRPNRP